MDGNHFPMLKTQLEENLVESWNFKASWDLFMETVNIPEIEETTDINTHNIIITDLIAKAAKTAILIKKSTTA